MYTFKNDPGGRDQAQYKALNDLFGYVDAYRDDVVLREMWLRHGQRDVRGNRISLCDPAHLTLIVLDCKEPSLMTWRSQAACLDEDPERFFPIGNTGPALARMEEAKVICHQCEVIEPCLKWAIEFGQDAGVWGGLSADERRALKRRTARARLTA